MTRAQLAKALREQCMRIDPTRDLTMGARSSRLYGLLTLLRFAADSLEDGTLERDARRYRWLRNLVLMGPYRFIKSDGNRVWIWKGEDPGEAYYSLDAALDAWIEEHGES